MDNARVLVTGGNGFLGSNLVHRLIEMDVSSIRVVDNLERGNICGLDTDNSQIEFLNCDLTDPRSCVKACNNIDIVFHCASKVGSIGYYENNAADILSNNITIDTEMLKAAQASNISLYVYFSSAFVYPVHRMQEPFGIPINELEAIPANPAISYGWAKLIGEIALQYAVQKDSNLRGIILRLSNFYGPNQSVDLKRGSIIPVLIRRALEYPNLSPFSIIGSGQETRTYCYISDVLDAIILAVKQNNKHKMIGPLNIGSEEPIRIHDLAMKVIQISGKNIDIVNLEAPQPKTLSQTLDCAQAKILLNGWKSKVCLDDGLRIMYSHISETL